MIRRSFIVIIPLLTIIFVFSALSAIMAKDKKKGVVLSTVDIDEDYEVLGLVYYRSSELSPGKIHKELKKQAEKMGADYVVGVTYYSNAGYLYSTGTAVKLIKDNSKE